METYKIIIAIELEKKFEGSEEAKAAAEEIGDNFQYYMESMKHAIDDLFVDCSSLTVKAHSNKVGPSSSVVSSVSK